MTNHDQSPAVIMRDVSFSYGPTLALEHVDLEIDKGDFACVVGPNGGGKTTLIKLVLGLLRPNRGEIVVLGRTPDASRSRLGYVPQYFNFDPSFPIKVFDVVLMGRLHRHRVWGRFDATDRRAAAAALDEVELGPLRDRSFSALSGGQRQRVLVARALASEPEVLILDEPMANIDPAGQDDLQDLLRQLHERLTILMVTHDMGFVFRQVNRVVCVNRTVWIHPTSELTGETIANLYGGGMNMIRHDHRCSGKGHEWSSF